MTTQFRIRSRFARSGARPNRKVRRVCLALEQLEERLTPAVSFSVSAFNPAELLPAGGNSPPRSSQYHGGPLLSNVQVQAMCYNDPTTLGMQGQFDGFFKDIVQSPWLTQMLAGYSAGGHTIGAGSFLGDDDTSLTVPEGSNLDTGTIYNQLTSEIAAGRLAPTTPNTLYAAFVPPGVEVDHNGGTSAVAFHISVFNRDTGALIMAFMELPYQGAAPDGATAPDGPNASFNHPTLCHEEIAGFPALSSSDAPGSGTPGTETPNPPQPLKS